MDLGQPDGTLIMAVLVGGSTWVQQRMTMPNRGPVDPQQQSMNNTMLVMMPLMFAFFTLQFPSGLALYWVATNVIGVVLQYFYQGPSQFDWRRIFSMTPSATPAAPAAREETKPAGEEAAAVGEEAAPAAAKRRRRRRRGRQRRR